MRTEPPFGADAPLLQVNLLAALLSESTLSIKNTKTLLNSGVFAFLCRIFMC